MREGDLNVCTPIYAVKLLGGGYRVRVMKSLVVGMWFCTVSDAFSSMCAGVLAARVTGSHLGCASASFIAYNLFDVYNVGHSCYQWVQICG